MAKTVGVHLSSDRIEAVVLEGTSKRWKILASECGDVAPPADEETPEAALTAAASALLKKARAPHDPVSLAVASTGAVFRNLTLPFTGDDAIGKVLKFESESHLHQFNIDDVVVVHVTAEERKGASDLIVAAAAKKFLRTQIDALDRAGFDPHVVDLDGLALFNALVATGIAPENGGVLVFHVGRTSTLALIVENRRLKLVRSMRTGLAVLERAVAADLGLPEGQAQEKVKELAATAATNGGGEDLIVTFDEAKGGARAETEKSATELESSLIDSRRADLVRWLQREAVRTLASGSRTNVAEVLVCGEGASLPGLLDAMSSATSLPAREADILETVEGAPTDIAQRRLLAVAFGAALKPLGVDAPKTDFRQEELKFARKLESLKLPLTALTGAIAFVLLFLNIIVFKEETTAKRSMAAYADVAESYALRAAPKAKAEISKHKEKEPVERFTEYDRFLNIDLQNLKNLFGSGGASFSKPQSALLATQKVFTVLKENENDLGLWVLDSYNAVSSDQPTPHVTVKLNITILGDGEAAARRLEILRKRLGEQKGFTVPVAGAKPVPGGLSIEGLTISIDLSKDTSS